MDYNNYFIFLTYNEPKTPKDMFEIKGMWGEERRVEENVTKMYLIKVQMIFFYPLFAIYIFKK